MACTGLGARWNLGALGATGAAGESLFTALHPTAHAFPHLRFRTCVSCTRVRLVPVPEWSCASAAQVLRMCGNASAICACAGTRVQCGAVPPSPPDCGHLGPPSGMGLCLTPSQCPTLVNSGPNFSFTKTKFWAKWSWSEHSRSGNLTGPY